MQTSVPPPPPPGVVAPASVIACGLPIALSEIKIWPDSAPVAVGVKVTVIVQVAPADKGVPQVLVCAKSPDMVTETMVIVPLPLLVSITV